MSEGKEILVGLKIWSKDHDWVEDEQKRIRNTQGKKPTQAELFQRMRNAYVPIADQAPKLSERYPYTDRNRDLHDKLEKLLNSGDERTIKAMVDFFFDRLKPTPKRKAGGR